MVAVAWRNKENIATTRAAMVISSLKIFGIAIGISGKPTTVSG